MIDHCLQNLLYSTSICHTKKTEFIITIELTLWLKLILL